MARLTIKPQNSNAPNNENAIEIPMVTVEKAAMKLRMSPQKMSMRVLAKRKGPRKPKSALLMKVKIVSAMKMKHVRSAEMMICRPVWGPRQRQTLHGDAATRRAVAALAACGVAGRAAHRGHPRSIVRRRCR